MEEEDTSMEDECRIVDKCKVRKRIKGMRISSERSRRCPLRSEWGIWMGGAAAEESRDADKWDEWIR
eukprot:2783097-Pyramimonas_sp.AAC.1